MIKLRFLVSCMQVTRERLYLFIRWLYNIIEMKLVQTSYIKIADIDFGAV